MPARKTRRSVKEYASELPEGIGLEWLPQRSLYRLYKRENKQVTLAQRRESVVLMWKRPERVFGYIARRVTGG